MKDTIIKGDGKSRVLQAPTDMPETFEQWRGQLISGTATLDIGLNADGCEIVGTPLNKNNLLSDDTGTALELESDDPTVNEALAAIANRKADKSKVKDVTLLASAWTGDNPYSQLTVIEGVTPESKIDAQMDEDLYFDMLDSETDALWFENNNGIVTAKAAGGKPDKDLSVQVSISLVVVVGRDPPQPAVKTPIVGQAAIPALHSASVYAADTVDTTATLTDIILGKTNIDKITAKCPKTRGKFSINSVAHVRAWGTQKAGGFDAQPIIAKGDADSIAAQAAEHPGVIPAAAVLPGYAAGGSPTGSEKPVCLVGLHGGAAADGTQLRQQSRLTAREAAAAAPQPTAEVPVAISYIAAPSEYRSLRQSIGFALACSGLI